MRGLGCCLVVCGLAGCGQAPPGGAVSGAGAGPATSARDARPGPELEAAERENARLQKELEALREDRGVKADGGGPGEPPRPAKVTLDGVEYEFIDIRRNGNAATMRLGITSKKGDARLLHQLRIRLIGTDGQEYMTPVGSSGGKGDQAGARLFEGQRRVIEFDLGKLPSDMNEIGTIILPGRGGAGFAKARENPAILKGKFKVE